MPAEQNQNQDFTVSELNASLGRLMPYGSTGASFAAVIITDITNHRDSSEEYVTGGIYMSATHGCYQRAREGWYIFGKAEMLPHHYPQRPLQRIDVQPGG